MIIECQCQTLCNIGDELLLELSNQAYHEYQITCPGCHNTYDVGMKITPHQKDYGYRDKLMLLHLYVACEYSMQGIADRFGTTPMTIYNWLKIHDIPTRRTGRSSR